MPQIHLTPELLAELIRLGFERYPREACGVLLPTPRDSRIESMIVELPNRSVTQDEYRIQGPDLRMALAGWAHEASAEQRNAVAVWHTHPGGNIGPSPGDLQSRIEGASYLVVALDVNSRSGIPTWF